MEPPRGVQLNGQVLADRRGIDVVLNRDRRVHVLALPLLSVTVKVTVFAAYVRAIEVRLLNVMVAMPQASEDPLSTWAAVMEPRRGVKLNGQVLADRGGGHVVLNRDRRRSSASIAVVVGHRQGHRIRAYVRAIEVRLLNVIEAIPQLSEEPLSTWAAVMEAAPLASS